MDHNTDSLTQRRLDSIKARFHAGDQRGALEELTRLLQEHAARTCAAADQATAALRDLRAILDDAPSSKVDNSGTRH